MIMYCQTNCLICDRPYDEAEAAKKLVDDKNCKNPECFASIHWHGTEDERTNERHAYYDAQERG